MTYESMAADVAAKTEAFMHKHADALYDRAEFSDVKDAVYPLFDAFSYSLFAGGKRLRPFLAALFCELCGGKSADVIPYAAALEMIHTFSLIHDDLPCMDNDDLRRGKPTNHTVFGEACALLAGDALSLYAFEAAADNTLTAAQNVKAMLCLARGAGVCGMIAGQQIDIWAETHDADEKTLTVLQSKKTGALFETACLLGCIAAGVPEDDARMNAARRFAAHFGLLFQIVDDILDVTGDTAVLGKPVGSDMENGKSTFVTLLGLDGAREKAKREADAAKDVLKQTFGSVDISVGLSFIDYLVVRQS